MSDDVHYIALKELSSVDLPDGGRVAFCGSFGDDLDVVNTAYVSTDKFVETYNDDKHGHFEEWLWEQGHTSPFRHQHMRFRIKCPIFVARQWMKHTVGSAWNERSGRYVEFADEYWAPEAWREGAASIKQGSKGPLGLHDQYAADQLYRDGMEHALKTYRSLLAHGVCREQARAVLPVSMMTELIWTVSLQALLHFLQLRLDAHAQAEIQLYAEAVFKLAKHERGGAFARALGVIARD